VPEPTAPVHRSAQRFEAVLAARGLAGRVVELPESTRTAAEAARAVGCDLRQIVKSLVFRGGTSGRPILLLVSGGHQVDESWVVRYVGEPLRRADPEFVRGTTGYAIGGVPPLGHAEPIPTYVDYDLLELPEVWAAAGHPHAVCRLTSGELLDLAGGRPIPVVSLPEPGPGRWVTFDCFGTLVDWKEGFARVVRRLGLARTPDEEVGLFERYLAAEKVEEAGPYRPYRDVLVRALRTAAVAVRELSEREAGELPESVPDWPAFADVPESLGALRAGGSRVALLSNIDRDLLERTVSNQRIPVDLLVTAEEVRSYKPAPPHWARFLKKTGAAIETVVHVSASVEYDLRTAAAMGFPTLYVARYGPPSNPGPVRRSVPGLGDLARVVASAP